MRSAANPRGLQRLAAFFSILALAACGGRGTGGTLPFGPGAQAQAQAQNLRGPLSLSRSARKVAALTPRSIARNGSKGAGYPVTADPPVKHPNETPCVDELFNPHTPPLNPSGLPVGDFADYADHPFNYTPPANCPGPYAKIIFKMHFRVSAGVQYDRTGAVWIGATNVFFGTTAEPGSNASPQWHVERDVTEYAPIFAQPSIGQASVYNIVNSQYTGIIYGRAELDFYPATTRYPAPAVADAVYPLSAGPTGGYVYLDGPSNQMTGTFTFPTNVQAAYLDVFLESQGGDEFWYTCFPNDLAQQLNNCGNTAFREGEVSVDGQPAGVAPIYPWIYSGGIDPYLWVPIPGVETLNFKPYRIDLTPFAATFDDGNQHTIAVSVFNDNNFFAANGALLLYEDHGSSQVTGALTGDGTPQSPNQNVVEHVKIDPSGNAKGTISVTASHPVSLSGYVNTSQGRISTHVTQRIAFSNFQKINVSSTQFMQNITQSTSIDSKTITTTKGRSLRTQSKWTYPLAVKYNYVVSGSSATQTTDIAQTKSGNGLDQTQGKGFSWSLTNAVQSRDTLNFTPSSFSPSGAKSGQQYKSRNVGRPCWNETLQSLNNVLTGMTKGC